MNILQTIISYYQGEARHGLWGAVIGGLLFIGGLVLLKYAAPLSLLKGLSAPMLLFGLLVGIGGGADSFQTRRIAPSRIALYQEDQITFLKQEKIKVERIHRGWRGIRIFWGLLGLCGLVLSFFITKPFLIGVGIGTLALAMIISLFEWYSMRFNEGYYHTVRAATVQVLPASVNKYNTHHQPLQAEGHQTTIEPQLRKKAHPKQIMVPLQPTLSLPDSAKSAPEPEIIVVAG